jgi:hypothetical protein
MEAVSRLAAKSPDPQPLFVYKPRFSVGKKRLPSDPPATAAATPIHVAGTPGKWSTRAASKLDEWGFGAIALKNC